MVSWLAAAACTEGAAWDAAPSALANAGAGAAEPPAADEQARIAEALALRGIASDAVHIGERHVTVDGDLVLDKADLLSSGDQLVDKGYFLCDESSCNMAVHPDIASRIRLVFDPSFPVGMERYGGGAKRWMDAFRDAAFQWSQGHRAFYGSSVYIDAYDKHPVGWEQAEIVVSSWGSFCDDGAAACAAGPSGTYSGYAARPGRWINVEPYHAASKDYGDMRYIAMHELGHTLGFMHPGVGSYIFPTDPEQDDSVMVPGDYDRYQHLRHDDELSLIIMYPDQRPYDPAPSAWNWNTCSEAWPCDVGEGDCDNDRQCKGMLVCGHDIGPRDGLASSADLCVPPAFQGNDSTRRACASENGYGRCNIACPCDRLQGQCTHDAQCGGRLVCSFHFNAQAVELKPAGSYKVCVEPALAGCPFFDQWNWSWSFCTRDCPCGAGQGDCDSNAQCKPGLVCGKDLGGMFGTSSTLDICVTPEVAAANNGSY